MTMNTGSHYAPSRIKQYFSSIAQRYDLVNRVLSMGLDRAWRRKVAELAGACNPVRILDLATGTGDLANDLRLRCSEATVVGADFCQPMLRIASKKVPEALLVTGDGLRLPFANDAFDVVTIAFGLRNMSDWRGAIVEMHRVLRPGGRLIVLDFAMPDPPLGPIYSIYLHHVLPRIAGALTAQRGAYEYLGDSITRFPKGTEMCDVFTGCGFQSCRAIPLCGGIVSIYTGDALK